MNTVTNKLKEWFSLDYRSLALMRIGIGILIIFDLIERSHNLVIFYSDQGILPRADLLNLFGNKWFVSLHIISGLPLVEGLLFVIAGIFAVMMIVGYRTKMATIVSWFLLISLHARNPIILQGGDVAFRAILFWMMFLPLDKRFSIDRLVNRATAPIGKMVLSPATLAYIVQAFLFYFMAGILKTGTAWHDGTAVYYALSVDQLIRPLGAWIRNIPTLTYYLTFSVHALETFGSFLYFSPIATGFFRTLAIVLYAGLQIGFNASMRLGLFGAISIVLTLGLLPPYFWEKCVQPIYLFFRHRARIGLSIYYDTNCGFCFKAVHMLLRGLILSDKTLVTPAQDDTEISRLMDQNNSWVVIDEHGTRYFGFQGLAVVIGYSPILAWFKYLLEIPGISHIGEYTYKIVATKRLLVCLPEKTIPPKTKIQQAMTTTGNGIIIFLTIYVVLWNIDTVKTKSFNLIPNQIEWIGWVTRLDQNFNMFSPTPLLEDGWYVFPGILTDGTEVNLFNQNLKHGNGVPVTYEKPKWVAYTYEDQRWQKYMMNLWGSDYTKYRLGYGKYICRTWNAAHTGDKTLHTFKMIFMVEKTPLPGQPVPTAVPTTTWEHQCF